MPLGSEQQAGNWNLTGSLNGTMLDNIVGNGLAHSVGEAAFILLENVEYPPRFLIIPRGKAADADGTSKPVPYERYSANSNLPVSVGWHKMKNGALAGEASPAKAPSFYGSSPDLNRAIISFVRLKSSGWSWMSSRDTHWAYFSSFSSMWMVSSPSSSQK